MSSKPSPSTSPTATPAPWSYRLILNVSPCSLGRKLIWKLMPTSAAHSRKASDAGSMCGGRLCTISQAAQAAPTTAKTITTHRTLARDILYLSDGLLGGG